jgi:cytochrome d ubiquinol oxidase subunit II
MGPVWEANHVWLIFVLVICWTAYPTVFASIFSTLTVPLFIAALGIILRGTAYAVHAGTAREIGRRRVDLVFSLSSILTPFALGAVIGGIASGRVPVGNAAGDLVTSWLNPTSIVIGLLAVATAAYLAAVYLAADAVRAGHAELAEAFRVRALATAVVAGGVAVAGLVVVYYDAEDLWDGLTTGWGLVSVLVSAAAGVGTLALVWLRRYEPARATAALAVAAIIAGWGFAQRPEILPGLTIDEAAAGRSTLVALIVSLALGALLLIPSLALLFGLVLRGRFDAPPADAPATPAHAPSHVRLLPIAVGCLAVGLPLMLLLDAGWAHAVGVAALLGFIATGFVAVAEAATTPPP